MTTKLEIDLRHGTKLSDHFNNRRDCYKVVEVDKVLGYVVSSGGSVSTATIYPLYRADIHLKAGKTWHVISSYEQGERFNNFTFDEDYEGCTFATIASQAIRALEERLHLQQLLKSAVAKKGRRSRKKGRPVNARQLTRR